LPAQNIRKYEAANWTKGTLNWTKGTLEFPGGHGRDYGLAMTDYVKKREA
jgi:hypothetical protein